MSIARILISVLSVNIVIIEKAASKLSAIMINVANLIVIDHYVTYQFSGGCGGANIVDMEVIILI